MSPGQLRIAQYLSPRKAAGVRSPCAPCDGRAESERLGADDDAAVFGDVGGADAAESRAPTSPTLRAMSIDVGVFRALPPGVQAEVYAEHLRAAAQRERLRRRPERMAERTAAGWRRHAAEAAVQHEARVRVDAGTYAADDAVVCAARRCVGEAPGPEPRASLVEVAPRPRALPPLHAGLGLDAWRTQLAAWVRVWHDAPRVQDVAAVERVLLECVYARPARLATVDGVLRWWAYVLGAEPPGAWRRALERVRGVVCRAVEASVGVRLCTI